MASNDVGRRRLLYAACVLVTTCVFMTAHMTSSRGYFMGTDRSSLTDPPPPPRSSGPNDYDVTATQLLRQRQLKKTCQKLKDKTADRNVLMQRMIVDHYNKFMYCIVPKAASTTTRKVIDHNIPKKGKKYRYMTGVTNVSEVMATMEDYFKFLFVRDPFQRLISAYRNKFEQGKDLAQVYGRKIVKTYRTNPSNRSLATGDDVTFLEFSRYVADGHDDVHWMTYQRLCRPCQVHYDFIGKYETLEEDLNYIVRQTNKNFDEGNFLKIPHKKRSLNGSTLNLLPSYKSVLPSSVKQTLSDIYSVDREMFNYTQDTGKR